MTERNSVYLNGGSAPKPPGFSALQTKACTGKQRAMLQHGPMLRSSVSALGLLPSIALSSEQTI